jgi:hypothetical protein
MELPVVRVKLDKVTPQVEWAMEKEIPSSPASDQADSV